MMPEIFGEWLQRQGLRVIRTASSYWHSKEARSLQAFPYHWLVEPSEAEVRDLLRRERALAVRYSTPTSAPAGRLSYHAVRPQGPYSLEQLDKKARYDIRKGLAYATVEPIPLGRLAAEGWRLHSETLARQGRSGAESRETWERLCRGAEGLPGFEAWGALHNGELAAALLAFTCEGCVTFLNQQSAAAHLRHGVNHALAYTFTRQALARPGVTQVFYSLHSLDAGPGVDQFKFRLGYAPRPVRQRVAFHPWAAPLFNRVTHAAAQQLVRWRPDAPALAKAEGMLRFHVEGRLPLASQKPPEGLAWNAARLSLGSGGMDGEAGF
jgi:hypothetical protein